jgi:hypothetical protein
MSIATSSNEGKDFFTLDGHFNTNGKGVNRITKTSIKKFKTSAISWADYPSNYLVRTVLRQR